MTINFEEKHAVSQAVTEAGHRYPSTRTEHYSVCSLFVILVILLFSCASIPSIQDLKQAEAFNKLGASYLSDGRLNQAYIEFQKANALNPDNKETLNYLGFISASFKKYDEAVSFYSRAISIDPDYAEALNNLGVTYAEMEEWDMAVTQFKAALSKPLYRTPALAYSNMGYAYYKKGDYINAEKAMQDALIRNPVSPRALYILGLVYAETDREKEAINELKKAIGILPDYTDAHWELALLYLKTGKKAKALKHFRLVAEKDSNKERVRKASTHIKQLKY